MLLLSVHWVRRVFPVQTQISGKKVRLNNVATKLAALVDRGGGRDRLGRHTAGSRSIVGHGRQRDPKQHE
jgi:hypothetical protein